MLVAGLGGIYAEALGDLTLWPIPAARADIERKLALGGLGRLLVSARWPWADTMAKIVDALCQLQDFALAVGERLEAVDVNPLKLTPDGPVAVDALVIIS
jgi:hypothetical protein